MCLEYLEAIVRVSEGYMVTVWLSSSATCRCPRQDGRDGACSSCAAIAGTGPRPSEQMVCVMCLQAFFVQDLGMFGVQRL